MFTSMRRAVLPAALVITSLFAAGPVAAQTVEECQDLINAVQAAADAAAFTNPKDYASVSSKVAAASAKLADGKTDDAVQKLINVQTQVASLASASKPKLSADDANAIASAAGEAISCIQALDG